MIHRLAAWQQWLSTGARLFLAGVFFASGWPKLLDLDQTVRSTRAFRLLPEAVVPTFGYALPIVELALAVLLLAGILTRASAAATAAMMVMFLFGIGSAWYRGLSLDCGCFGGTGTTVADPVPGYIRDLIRDTVFLAVAVGLARWPRSRFAADGPLGLVPAESPTEVTEQPAEATDR